MSDFPPPTPCARCGGTGLVGGKTDFHYDVASECPECSPLQKLIPRTPARPGSKRTIAIHDPTEDRWKKAGKSMQQIVSEAVDFVNTMPDHEITAARNAGVLDPRWERPTDAPVDIVDKLRARRPRDGSIEHECLVEIERLRYIVGMYRDTSDA